MALEYGVSYSGLFTDICDEPKRNTKHTPRGVYGEMCRWTADEWRQWAAERADEQRAADYRADRLDQTMPV
jgi:fibrillarin-like rRNA methylase